ncbi:MAG: S8 family serine peptidase, partial [Cyanobacteriota bacterium]
GSVTDSALESFLGLSTRALDGMGNGNAVQGSAIKLPTITVAAGTTLTFDWNFLTNETTPGNFFNDFAFVSINGLSELADTESSFALSPSAFNKETGYAQFSYTFTTAGTYTIGLGVVDTGDTTIDSALLIDNFSLTPNGVHIVNLASDQSVNNINFGSRAISVLAEPNDTIGLAIATGLSSTSPGTFKDKGAIGDNPNLASGLDVDFLQIQLNAGDQVTIDIDTAGLNSSLNSVVRLFDLSGNQLAFNDNAAASGETSSLDSYLEFTATVSGTYYIGVSGLGNSSYDPSIQGSGSLGSTGNYNIEVSLIPDFNSNYGYGLVDAAAAVANALEQSSPFSDVANLGGNNWGLDMVKAPEVWAKGYTGQGIVVAVIDTGVDYNHPDLDANIWVNSGEIAGNNNDDDGNGFIDDVRGWDFVDNDNKPMDGGTHGTHVAGTIAAEKNDFGVTGIAYNAKIMPVRVIGDQSWDQYHQDLAQGIRYAADNGANVINLSLRTLTDISAVKDAIKYAEGKGCVVVMAAGNDGDSQPLYPAYYATDWGIAAGAVDNTNKMASFSNRAGTTLLDYIVAPGVNVYSTTPGNTYSYYSGTSMATPHVAGVAALLLSANPNLTAAEVENILIKTANPTGITV